MNDDIVESIKSYKSMSQCPSKRNPSCYTLRIVVKLLPFTLSLFVLIIIIICLLPAVTVGEFLDDILLEDLIPNHLDESACNDDEASTETSFEFKTLPESRWSNGNAPHEKLAFLARMSHFDKDNPNRTWTASFGHGGNIYSWIGAAFGEAIAPQTNVLSPWVDEVIQSVAVDSKALSQEHKLYYIHQAGTYVYDTSYMPPPFYSPNVAKTCFKGTCRFASWGQQAHVPTDLESNVLYLHQYRNCGKGVMEYTQMVMNMNNDYKAHLDYINIPWAGVRSSTFQQIHLSDVNGTMKEAENPLQKFGEEKKFYNLDQTGGYTTFAHTPPEHFLELPCAIPISLHKSLNITKNNIVKYSCSNQDIHSNHYVRIKLVVQANNTCEYLPQASINQGGYVVQLKTHDASLPNIGGCRQCMTKFGMKFINERTGEWIHVPDIVWWYHSSGYTFFKTSNNMTETHINQIFFEGDTIRVTSMQPDRMQDKLALSYVHGVDEEYDDAGNREWMYLPMRLRYGIAGRDYTVLTVNARVTVPPGKTYMNRQYLINDQLLNIEEQANNWVDQTFADMLHHKDFRGRILTLFTDNPNQNEKKNSTSFGVALGNSTSSCRRKDTLARCIGSTTPKNNLKPFFYITCGDSTYVGPDQYFFSSKKENIRSYVCAGMDKNIRPNWKLIGHFDDNERECRNLLNLTFDEDYCNVPQHEIIDDSKKVMRNQTKNY